MYPDLESCRSIIVTWMKECGYYSNYGFRGEDHSGFIGIDADDLMNRLFGTTRTLEDD